MGNVWWAKKIAGKTKLLLKWYICQNFPIFMCIILVLFIIGLRTRKRRHTHSALWLSFNNVIIVFSINITFLSQPQWQHNTTLCKPPTHPTIKLNFSLEEPQINIYWPIQNKMWQVTTSSAKIKTSITTTTASITTTISITTTKKQQQQLNFIDNN